MNRPTTAASSARPYTSSGARPTTGAHDLDHFGPNYDLEEEEEEYEESDDEDVFAFLPPSTADQEQERQPQYPQSHVQPNDDFSHYLSQPVYGEAPADSLFANSIPSLEPSITYPEPTFDPYARFPADSQSPMGAGPSTPQFQYFQPPPQSPPSTESNNHDDPYRMQRMARAPPTAVSQVPTVDSREVRISLPSPAESMLGDEKDPESGMMRQKRLTSSLAESLSLSHSVMEDDESREGSIK